MIGFRFNRVLSTALAVLLPALAFGTARADDDIHPFSDAEVEQTVRTFATPIWIAAGLKPEDVHIVLVDDPTLNSFVAAGQNIFVFTGMIEATDNPSQLIGVLAHETGHIADGHLVRSSEGAEDATYTMLLATVLGAVAAAGSHDPGAIAGALGGGEEMGMRSFFAFTRAQEGSADQAGISFLEKAHMSPKGMYEFMQKLNAEDGPPATREAEYVQTHPLTQDRVEAIGYAVGRSHYVDAGLPPEWVEMHARIKAKLIGYLQPQYALKRYSKADTSLAGRYGRSIALWRTGQIDPAIQLIDGLIQERPKDPYFYHAKAQMLFAEGRIPDSITAFKKAVELAPASAAEIHMEYAQALIERDDPSLLPTAIDQLKQADAQEDRRPFAEYDLAGIHRFLAIAYGKQGNEPLAKVELAEQNIYEGNIKEGRAQARAAMRLLPTGSRDWLRAQDLLSTSKPGKHGSDGDTSGFHLSVGPADGDRVTGFPELR